LAEYKNPNQQGGKQDSSSLLILMTVVLAIFLGMQVFRPKTPAKGPAQTNQKGQETTASVGEANGAAPAKNSVAAGAESTSAVPRVAAAKEATTTVENELYKITFSNRGGEVTSWILKKYTDYENKPLDLVNTTAAKKFGYPLSIYTSDANLRQQMTQALYVSSATGNLAAPSQLSFDYSAGGLVVHKVFHFDNSYVIRAEITVTRNGQPVQAMLAWPAGFGDQREPRNYSTDQKLDRAANGKTESTAPKKVVDGEAHPGMLDWGGVSDLYFAAIFLPDKPDNSTLVSLRNTMEVPSDPSDPHSKMEALPVLGAAVGATDGTTSLRLFAGPKVLSLLHSIRATGTNGKATGPNLVSLVHYGVFSIVAKPLFYLLSWVHTYVTPHKNGWGWAILLLTLIITMATFPTRYTTMKSSIKMQRIQPQMNYIKEKYKKYKFDDPRKQDMNKEMQELYKKEGVNMFGSCLPMLIQLPLIWAFYEMLENAIELRNAHWFWLHDLSAADPYHILPILMVVSQFFFQLFTPSPGVDAQQQKMMAFTMPLFSGWICWHYASGLALYWAGSNIIGIGQQMFINQTKLGKELREIQLKRAMKKKGGKPSAVARR